VHGKERPVWSCGAVDWIGRPLISSTPSPGHRQVTAGSSATEVSSVGTAVEQGYNSLDLSSAEIADREIKIWKTRTIPFPKDKNPLDECHCGAVHLFPWLGVLARHVLDIPVSSSAPERLFSTVGNVMTKKRSRLTCDNTEELVYLHEVLPQVWEWESIQKMRLA